MATNIQEKAVEILSCINKLRTNPKSCIDELDILSKAFTRYQKKKEGQAISEFAKSLKNRPTVEEITISSLLTKLSYDKLEIYLKNIKEDDEEKSKRIEKYCSGYSKFEELIIEDVSEDEITNGLYAKLILGNHFDNTKKNSESFKNKQIILHSDLNYGGIAIIEQDSKFNILISLADNIKEKHSKSLDSEVFDYLQYLRQYPYKASLLVEKVKNNINLKDKNSKALIDNINEFNNKLSKNSLNDLKRFKELDELALYFYEKIVNGELTNISDTYQVSEIAKSSIHGFSNNNLFLSFVEVTGNKSVNNIIINMIYNNAQKNKDILKQQRNIFLNNNIRELGIFVNGESDKTTHIVIFGVDMHYSGSEIPYHSIMEKELNKIRNNPSSYKGNIDNWIKELKEKSYRKSGTEAAKEILDCLEDSSDNNESYIKKANNNLKNLESLNSACEDYVYFYDKKFGNIKPVYAEDEEELLSRLNFYVKGHKKAAAFVETCCSRPEHFITELLISEKEQSLNSKFGRNVNLNLKSHKMLFSDEFNYFGCLTAEVKGQKITVLILVDNAESLEDDLLEQNVESMLFRSINLLRNHPKTFAKYLFSYYQDLEYKKQSASQNTYTSKRGTYSKSEANKLYDDKMSFIDEVVSYVKSTRSSKALERKEFLDRIASIKLESDHGVKHYNIKSAKSSSSTLKKLNNTVNTQSNINTQTSSSEDLREFLKIYASNYYYVNEIQGRAEVEIFDIEVVNEENKDYQKKAVFDSGLFLAKLVVDFLDINYIKQIMHPYYTKIGLFYNEESSMIEVLMLDHAIEKEEISIKVNLHQKVIRPTLTIDEVEQIRNDFNKFDINEQGFIKPDLVLTFMNKSAAFINNNPIYYNAMKRINSVENNRIGANVNMFIDACIESCREIARKEWESMFECFIRISNKNEGNKINHSAFIDITKSLGYELSDSQINDIFDRVLGENTSLSKKEFIKLMEMVEGYYKN